MQLRPYPFHEVRRPLVGGAGVEEGAAVAEFSAADAAITGFRIVWQRPRVLAVWAPVQLVLSLALSLFVAATAGSALSRFGALAQQPTPDPAAAAAILRELAPTLMALFAYALVTSAVIYAAMNRAVLRPSDTRFGYLRLSSDELRQLGLLGVMAVAAGLGFWVVFSLLASGGEAGAMAGLIAFPALIGAVIFLGVRFSLASPITFASGRINFMGSWEMTRGRFWPLLGTYLIAFGLRFVVYLLTLAISGAAGALAGAVGGGRLPDMYSVASVISPPGLVELVVSAIGQALAWPITTTPPATIYRALGGGGARLASMFD